MVPLFLPSILIGFSIIFNHPFWGFSPYFWKTYIITTIHTFWEHDLAWFNLPNYPAIHAHLFPISDGCHRFLIERRWCWHVSCIILQYRRANLAYIGTNSKVSNITCNVWIIQLIHIHTYTVSYIVPKISSVSDVSLATLMKKNINNALISEADGSCRRPGAEIRSKGTRSKELHWGVEGGQSAISIRWEAMNGAVERFN